MLFDIKLMRKKIKIIQSIFIATLTKNDISSMILNVGRSFNNCDIGAI